MNDEEPLTEEQLINLHSAGAIVGHRNPFAHLSTPLSISPMSQAMREKWVNPFYMQPLDEESPDFIVACAETTPEITLSLLSEYNWRPRVVGARFVGVRQFVDLQQDISNLLLKSELCCVGSDYCLALAALGNEAAADTLSEYLDYYLNHPDLWFDQGYAMAALLYVDELHGSNKAAQFLMPWHKFISNKPYWKLENYKELFHNSITALQEISRIVATR